MKIRPVSPVEFDLFYGDLQDKNRRDAYLASCSAPCDAILSAFLRDAPAGYAVCRVEKRTGGIRLSVQAMFVREECRRRGVAKALLAEAENLCRASETGVGLVKLCLMEGSGSFSSGSEFLLANG
ncbi:MAG: GNAT family N-acetyltransferase, partial [Synergistaceae bacterium]|nr:GNAT family N-acetyltransferase [Synergistaceae bacterium]